MKKIFICFCLILLSNLTLLSVEAKEVKASDNVISASLIMSYKDASHNLRTLSKMRKQTRNLSEDEKNIIKKYVFGAVRGEDTYLLINCYLRDNLEEYIPKKEITKPLKCRLDYYAKSLTAPISKAKLPKNMLLYRGIDEKGMNSLFKDKKLSKTINAPVTEQNLAIIRKALIGSKFSEKGFMSTSYDKNCAKQTKFIFELKAPKNLQALLIEDLGKKKEKEVLINKNTSWEIIDITIQKSKNTKKDYYNIKVKIVL